MPDRALSPAEARLLVALAEGSPQKVAAARLGISVSTVKAELSVAYRKLGAHSLVDAYAIMGWLRPPGRRAPVQAERGRHGPGTIPWETHLAAWDGYAAAGHGSQSAERIAERGGFSYREVQCALAGHYREVPGCRREHPAPEGWTPGG